MLRTTRLVPIGLASLAILLSLAAGVSALVFKSALAPLVVVAGVLAVLFAFVLLGKPIWTLYILVFVGFLPGDIAELIPVTIVARYLFMLVALLAGFLWLLDTTLHRRKIIFTGPVLLTSGFVIWCITSLLWAPDMTLGRQTMTPLLIFFAFMVILINQIDSAKALDGLMLTLALAGWMLVVAGMGTVLVEGYTPGVRLKVLGINENAYAMQLMLVMPGPLWQASRNNGRWMMLKQGQALVYFLSTMALVALSGSRGGAISLGIILLAFCCWRSTRVWGLLGILIIVLGLAMAPLLFSTTLERFAVTEGDTLLGGREILWEAAWDMIVDNPWLGAGFGNARQELLAYVSALQGTGGAEKAPAHNPVLQIWAEVGLPGLLIYLSIMGSAAWQLIRRYLLCRQFDLQDLVPYFALMSSTFLGYLVSWIKGGGAELAFTFFLMMGLLDIPSYLDTYRPPQST